MKQLLFGTIAWMLFFAVGCKKQDMVSTVSSSSFTKEVTPSNIGSGPQLLFMNDNKMYSMFNPQGDNPVLTLKGPVDYSFFANTPWENSWAYSTATNELFVMGKYVSDNFYLRLSGENKMKYLSFGYGTTVRNDMILNPSGTRLYFIRHYVTEAKDSMVQILSTDLQLKNTITHFWVHEHSNDPILNIGIDFLHNKVYLTHGLYEKNNQKIAVFKYGPNEEHLGTYTDIAKVHEPFYPGTLKIDPQNEKIYLATRLTNPKKYRVWSIGTTGEPGSWKKIVDVSYVHPHQPSIAQHFSFDIFPGYKQVFYALHDYVNDKHVSTIGRVHTESPGIIKVLYFGHDVNNILVAQPQSMPDK